MTNPIGASDSGGGFSTEMWLSHTEERQSEAELQERVWDEIRKESLTGWDTISVEVEDGVVTLSGTVPSTAATLAAQRAAWRAPRVRSVINLLTVGG